MSTVVVVRKNGKIVIGADTMAKFGTVKQRIKFVKGGSKIVKFGDNYIAYVGSGTFGNVLRKYFSELEEVPLLDSTNLIFQMSLELHESLKEDYFLNPMEEDDDPFESSQFDCLIANSTGIYGLYALRTVDEFSQYFSFGSGLKFALGAMHSLYNTDATAEEIARAGLEAAAEFDDCSDLPIELYVLKENNVKSELL